MKAFSKERLIKYGIPFACVFMLACIIGGGFGFFYVSNDDCLLNTILSGAYTGEPEAHDIYHMYPLAYAITVLYRIMPGLPWYGLFLWTAQFGALYVCLVRIAGRIEGFRKVLGASLLGTLFFAGIFLPHLALIQYTLTAAVLAGAAIFLTVTGTQWEGSMGRFLLCRLPEIVLYLLSFALRRQMGLLLLPFLLGACLYRVVCLYRTEGSHSGGWKKGVAFFLTLLGSTALLWGIDRLAYSAPAWSEYQVFNETRTNIFDFGKIPPYAEEREFYESLEISEEEQMLLEMDDFVLSDRFHTETMREIDMFQGRYFDYMYTKEYIKKVLLLVKNRMTTDLDFPFGVVVIGLYILALIGFVTEKKYEGVLGVLYLAMVHVVCWAYLLWQNRLPDRVTHGLYLAEIVTLAAICTCLWKKQAVLMTALGVLACYSLFVNGKGLPEQIVRTEQRIEDWNSIKEYCLDNSENFYLLDTVSFANYAEPLFVREKEVLNYSLCGGWAANSPVFYDKLCRFGVDGTISDGLAEGKEFYLIVEDKRDTQVFGLPQRTDVWVREFIEQITVSDKEYHVYAIRKAE